MTQELQKKVDRAIKLIQSASKIAAANGCPQIEVAYSGGKDSDVILELTKMANVPYRAIYKNTTIDPAGTIKHALENGAEIRRPKISFRDVLAKVGLVSRFRRSCCQYLKEYKIFDYQILGIRANESKKREERYKEPEMCRSYSKKSKARQYFPILDWSKEDIKEFIEERNIVCHPLYYDENRLFHVERRLGCLCCPMQSQKARLRDFELHPNMVKLYIRGGGQKFLDSHPNSKIHKSFNDVYEWFCMAIFTKSMNEFRTRFGENLFDDGIDCKKFLEDYFKIKFKD